jgi:hypothetical protein
MVAYWPLMKGCSQAGCAAARPSPRPTAAHKYPIFKGAEFERNLDFVDASLPVARPRTAPTPRPRARLDRGATGDHRAYSSEPHRRSRSRERSGPDV